MYFDAVLTEEYIPLANGTPAEIREWLLENKSFIHAKSCQVCIGKTMQLVSVENYLAGNV